MLLQFESSRRITVDCRFAVHPLRRLVYSRISHAKEKVSWHIYSVQKLGAVIDACITEAQALANAATSSDHGADDPDTHSDSDQRGSAQPRSQHSACCPDEQAQPPFLRTIHLSVRESSSIDPPTPCPDGDINSYLPFVPLAWVAACLPIFAIAKKYGHFP